MEGKEQRGCIVRLEESDITLSSPLTGISHVTTWEAEKYYHFVLDEEMGLGM